MLILNKHICLQDQNYFQYKIKYHLCKMGHNWDAVLEFRKKESEMLILNKHIHAMVSKLYNVWEIVVDLKWKILKKFICLG
jgi:hypothetical protein